MNHERAFRDYATRVSFNISMSRNQVAVFRAVVLDLESPRFRRFDTGMMHGVGRDALERERRALGIVNQDMMGLRWLIANGFVREHPKINAMRLAHERDPAKNKWDWNLFDKYDPHLLTEAGEHMAALLRIAGLIPQRASNVNTEKKKRRA